jgi:hypothetical protein
MALNTIPQQSLTAVTAYAVGLENPYGETPYPRRGKAQKSITNTLYYNIL